MSDKPLDRLEVVTAVLLFTVCIGLMLLVAGTHG